MDHFVDIFLKIRGEGRDGDKDRDGGLVPLGEPNSVGP